MRHWINLMVLVTGVCAIEDWIQRHMTEPWRGKWLQQDWSLFLLKMRPRASSSGKTAPEPWLTVLSALSFWGCGSFPPDNQNVSSLSVFQEGNAEVHEPPVLKRMRAESSWLFTVCARAHAGGLPLQVLGVDLSVSQGALWSADPPDSPEKS